MIIYIRKSIETPNSALCSVGRMLIYFSNSCYASNSEDFRAKRRQSGSDSEDFRAKRSNPDQIPKISELNGGNPDRIPKISELNAAIRIRFRRFLS
jgi:hypothetical protein